MRLVNEMWLNEPNDDDDDVPATEDDDREAAVDDESDVEAHGGWGGIAAPPA